MQARTQKYQTAPRLASFTTNANAYTANFQGCGFTLEHLLSLGTRESHNLVLNSWLQFGEILYTAC